MIHASGARAGLEVHPRAEGGARWDTAVDSRGQAQGLWAKSSILRSRIGSLVCSVGRRKASEREETLINISSVGIIPTSIATPKTNRAGASDLVRRVKSFVNTADIVSESRVIALVVDCVGSKDVLNTMEAVVDTASIGGKPSGVTLIVDCARSTKVVDGVESPVGTIFTDIIILAVVSNGSGEATQGAQGTVESIMSSVVASAIDWSSGGAERVKTLIDKITAEPRGLSTGVALVADHVGASEVIEGVAGRVSVGNSGPNQLV